MDGSWSLLLAAFGLALFLEGLPYFISPPMMRRYVQHVARTGDAALRTLGLFMMLIGLLVAYLATR